MKIAYGQELISELRRRGDKLKNRLWIAVPYIGGRTTITRILGRNWIDNSSISIRLLTDINELTNFNSETLRLFSLNGSIRHIAGLHAKIYITDYGCLLTSANLTNTAFTKRHEVGIFLDKHDSKGAISTFEKWWKTAEKVCVEQLALPSKTNASREDREGLKLPSRWTLPPAPREVNYWLKPIGSDDDPILENRLFGDMRTNLHFSAVEPKGVKIGDVLIAYGVGAKRILSIYRVLSSPNKMTEAEIRESRLRRWPWYVNATNITPKFGARWNHHNVYASELVSDFLRCHPTGYITKVKGKTLGALRWGADKINLDPEFARFVVTKIGALNAEVGAIKRLR
jgi:hypothetical protein